MRVKIRLGIMSMGLCFTAAAASTIGYVHATHLYLAKDPKPAVSAHLEFVNDDYIQGEPQRLVDHYSSERGFNHQPGETIDTTADRIMWQFSNVLLFALGCSFITQGLLYRALNAAKKRTSHLFGRELDDRAQQRTDELARLNDQLTLDKEKFHQFIEQSKDGILLGDEEGRIIEWNSAIEQMMGLSRAEVLNQFAWDIQYRIAPEEYRKPGAYEQLKTAGQQLISTGESPLLGQVQEQTIQTPSGKCHSIQIQTFPIKTNRGYMVGSIVRDITEKKAVGEALQESERRYRTLFDSAGDAIFVHDFEGRIQDVNQTACERLGYSRDELLNMNIREINSPEYASQIPARYHELYQNNQAMSQTVHLTLDGRQIPVEISMRRIERSGQNVVLNIVRDITERKRVEDAELDQRIMAEALRDTASVVNSTLHLEQVLERILDNVGRVVLHDAVHIILIENNLSRVVCQRGYIEHGIESGLDTLIWSSATVNIMHQARLRGETIIIDDVHHQPDWVTLIQDNPKLNWLHSFVAAPIRRHDQLMGFIVLNSAVPYFYTPLLASRLQTFADQAAIAIHNANLYEAERRARILAETFQQTAEALASSARLEDTLDLAIEQLGKVLHYDYAQILLVEGEKLRVVAARKLTNHNERLATHEINEYYSNIGYLYAPLASGQPLVIENVRQSPYADHLQAIEPETYCWAGIPLVVWEVVIGLLSVSSRQGGTYNPREIETMEAFAHQVALAIENSQLYTRLETSQTNLQQVQATLTRTARLSVAGEIAAGIAHQINNPLTAIVAQSYLLLKRLPVDDPNYNSIAIIRQAAYQAGTVVQHLLNFARPSTYDVHLIDINLSIQYAVSLIRAQIEPSAHLVENLAPDLPMIKASSQHLEDLWINLLINAKDAISEMENGEIQITSRFGENQRTIEVEIADNGIGIAPEHQEHIFDPFFTTKNAGQVWGCPPATAQLPATEGVFESRVSFTVAALLLLFCLSI